MVVADPLGCFDTSAVVVVQLTAADTLFLGLDTAICPGQALMLVGRGAYANWFWSTGDSSRTTTVDQPGLYTLYAYDPEGCVSIGQVMVAALECADSTVTGVVPNILTPNGDGVNEGWGFGPEAPYDQVVIFNRWGNEVFRADPRLEHWSGRDHEGHELPDGVYFYALSGIDGLGEFALIKGYIHLVRH